jgi:DNA-binding Lrp family transcriptional regulator
MPRVKLDKIDRKILHHLQSNARMTNVELAQAAGISAPPCLRRVRALEEKDIIRGYHAHLNHAALGYTVCVFAYVKLVSQAEPDLRKFEDSVKEWDMVRECHMIAGEVDYILKVVAPDWSSYQQFLANELSATDNVTSVKSNLSMATVKDTPGIPVAPGV